MDSRGSRGANRSRRRHGTAAAFLLVLLIVTTLGAASASAAELPQVGQCVRIALAKQPKTGRFKDKKCTKQSAGEDTGSYEFRAMPAAEAKFAQSAAPFAFGARGAAHEVACSAVQGEGRTPVIEGEFTGLQSMQVMFRFASCSVKSASGSYGCRAVDDPAHAGEPVTAVLEGQLGFLDGKIAKPTVGWELKPALGGPLMELECLVIGPVLVSGSLVTEVTPADKASNYEQFYFATEKKHVVPAALEGMEPAALEIAAEGTSEAAAPSGHAETLSAYGPEIKALP